MLPRHTGYADGAMVLFEIPKPRASTETDNYDRHFKQNDHRASRRDSISVSLG